MPKCKNERCGYSTPKPLETCPRCDEPFPGSKAAAAKKKEDAAAAKQSKSAPKKEAATPKETDAGARPGSVPAPDGSIPDDPSAPKVGHEADSVALPPAKAIPPDATHATRTPEEGRQMGRPEPKDEPLPSIGEKAFEARDPNDPDQVRTAREFKAKQNKGEAKVGKSKAKAIGAQKGKIPGGPKRPVTSNKAASSKVIRSSKATSRKK